MKKLRQGGRRTICMVVVVTNNMQGGRSWNKTSPLYPVGRDLDPWSRPHMSHMTSGVHLLHLVWCHFPSQTHMLPNPMEIAQFFTYMASNDGRLHGEANDVTTRSLASQNTLICMLSGKVCLLEKIPRKTFIHNQHLWDKTLPMHPVGHDLDHPI